MAQRADVGQEAILDHVHRAAAREAAHEPFVRRPARGDERLGGQDPRRQRLLDDVLALSKELAVLAAVALCLEPAGVLQPGVLR